MNNTLTNQQLGPACQELAAAINRAFDYSKQQAALWKPRRCPKGFKW